VRVDFADVAVDTRTREIHRAGERVHLSPKAFELLLILIESRPQAVAKRVLQDRLWPDTFVVEKNLANLDRPHAGPTDPTAPSAGGTEARLTWTLSRATLREGEHIVGRVADAAICLEAESVSRRMPGSW
jgi:hypothetical protein